MRTYAICDFGANGMICANSAQRVFAKRRKSRFRILVHSFKARSASEATQNRFDFEPEPSESLLTSGEAKQIFVFA